jgi:hypothetical protein
MPAISAACSVRNIASFSNPAPSRLPCQLVAIASPRYSISGIGVTDQETVHRFLTPIEGINLVLPAELLDPLPDIVMTTSPALLRSDSREHAREDSRVS